MLVDRRPREDDCGERVGQSEFERWQTAKEPSGGQKQDEEGDLASNLLQQPGGDFLGDEKVDQGRIVGAAVLQDLLDHHLWGVQEKGRREDDPEHRKRCPKPEEARPPCPLAHCQPERQEQEHGLE